MFTLYLCFPSQSPYYYFFFLSFFFPLLVALLLTTSRKSQLKWNILVVLCSFDGTIKTKLISWFNIKTFLLVMLWKLVSSWGKKIASYFYHEVCCNYVFYALDSWILVRLMLGLGNLKNFSVHLKLNRMIAELKINYIKIENGYPNDWILLLNEFYLMNNSQLVSNHYQQFDNHSCTLVITIRFKNNDENFILKNYLTAVVGFVFIVKFCRYNYIW